jgi:FkbM family methyltransferase
LLSKAYDLVLKLPRFRGRGRIDSLLRNLLAPKASTIVHGLRMELDPQEWSQVDLRATGRLEPCTTALFDRLLRTGATYVDVGAHVGYHTLVARHLVGEGGRLIAIDPQPYNCDRLLTNAELNSFHNITVMAAAVGRTDGFVSLKNQSRNDRARLTLAGSGVNDGPLSFVVPTISLLSLFKMHELECVDLLKIDVEGLELDVLQGAGDALASVRNIVLEILPDRRAETADAIDQLLRGFGFRLFDVQGGQWHPGRPCIENNVWASCSTR